MISTPLTLSAILIGVAAASAPEGAAVAVCADGLDVREVVQGNTAFAVDLYRRLGTEPGNLFGTESTAQPTWSLPGKPWSLSATDGADGALPCAPKAWVRK